MNSGLIVRTDVVILPEPFMVGGTPHSLVTVHVSVVATLPSSGKPNLPELAAAPYDLFLQPWDWWGGYERHVKGDPAPKQPLFELFNVDLPKERFALTGELLKLPAVFARRDAWLKAQRAAFQDTVHGAAPGYLYQANGTPLDWSNGLEAMGRLPTPLPQIAQLSFIFLVQDNALESSPLRPTDPKKVNRFIVTPVVPQAGGASGITSSGIAWTTDKDTATGRSTSMESLPITFECKIAPPVAALQDMSGGRLIDMTSLMSRVHATGVTPGTSAWRADNWHAAFEAKLAAVASPFDFATRAFSDLAAKGAFAGRNALAYDAVAAIAKSLPETMIPWGPKPSLLSAAAWLYADKDEGALRVPALRKAAGDLVATAPGFVQLVAGTIGLSYSEIPELSRWATLADTDKVNFDLNTLPALAAELRRVAAALHETAAWARLFAKLPGGAVPPFKIDLTDTSQAPELVQRLKVDRAQEGRSLNFPTPDPKAPSPLSLLQIAAQAGDGTAVEPQRLAGNAQTVAQCMVAAGISAAGGDAQTVFDVFKGAAETLGREFAASLVEASEDGGDNTGAGGPPSIAIAVDQAGQADAVTSHKDFDLQALLNGYGLLVQAGSGPDWKIANMSAATWRWRTTPLGAIHEIPDFLDDVPAPLGVTYRTVGDGEQLRQPVATFSEQPLLPLMTPVAALDKDPEQDDDVLMKIFGNDLVPLAGYTTPSLAAGADYRLIAYWIGPAGVLPRALRPETKPDEPLLLAPHAGNVFELLHPEDLDDFIHQASLRRRTPVGPPVLSTATQSKTANNPDLKAMLAIPEWVRPLWEDLLPTLPTADAEALRDAPRILLWDRTGPYEVKAGDPRKTYPSPPKVKFRLSPPRISLSDWRFWNMRDYKNSAPDTIARVQNVCAAVSMLGAAADMKLATSGGLPTDLTLADPSVWQLAANDAVSGKRTGKLRCRIRRLTTKPGDLKQDTTRWKGSLAGAGSTPNNYVSRTYEISGTGPLSPTALPVSIPTTPEELQAWFAAEQGGEATFAVRRVPGNPAIERDGNSNSFTVSLPPGGLFALEFAWLANRSERFTASAAPSKIDVTYEGEDRRFLVETAPAAASKPTQTDLWKAISIRPSAVASAVPAVGGQVSAGGSLMAFDIKPSDPLIAFEDDPFAGIGWIAPGWQNWRWDGAPINARPFKSGNPDDAVVRERDAGPYAPDEPGATWEAAAFEGRGLAGLAAPLTPYNAVARNVTVATIPLPRPQSATYIRAKAEAVWRYVGLLPDSGVAAVHVQSQRPQYPTGTAYDDDVRALLPWHGFAIKAAVAAKPAAPKIRWVTPLMSNTAGDVMPKSFKGASAFLLMLEEPVFAANTGHGLAENFQIEVVTYTPPGLDPVAPPAVDKSYPRVAPMIGDDPILNTTPWDAGALQVGDTSTVWFSCDPLTDALGESIEPDLPEPRIATAVLIVDPIVRLAPRDAKGNEPNDPGNAKEIDLGPWTFARIRVRRALDSTACTLLADPDLASPLYGDWSSPFNIQVTRNMSMFRAGDAGSDWHQVNKFQLDEAGAIRLDDKTAINLENSDPMRWYALTGIEGVEAGGRRRRAAGLQLSTLEKLGKLGASGDPNTDRRFVHLVLAQWRSGIDIDAQEADHADELFTKFGLFGVNGDPVDPTTKWPNVRVVGISPRIYQGQRP